MGAPWEGSLSLLGLRGPVGLSGPQGLIAPQGLIGPEGFMAPQGAQGSLLNDMWLGP